MQKMKATPKNDGVPKCPDCGAGLKQLFLQTSLFCPNSCDRKDQAKANSGGATQVTWYLGSKDHGKYQPGEMIPATTIRKDGQSFGTRVPYVYEVVPTTPPVSISSSKDSGTPRWTASVKIIKKVKG